jgi:N-acetylglutamate synthase-like GNAT family acetyltransferase
LFAGSAFVHFNTGTTELEYFGKGRFLLMCQNQTPHIHPDEYAKFRSGGSLKDGWSYLMPNDEFILNAEVSVAFLDEMDEHVREQSEALKSLYLSSHDTQQLHANTNLLVEEEIAENSRKPDDVHFIVQRGLQVVGVATYSEKTGKLFDVAVRPSAGNEVAETLLKSVKDHARRIGRSGSLMVRPRSADSSRMFQELGFRERADSSEMELEH